MTTSMVGRRSTMTGQPFTADDVAKLFTRFIARHLPAAGTVELASADGMPLGIWRQVTVGDGEFRAALGTALGTGALIGLTVDNTVTAWKTADGTIIAVAQAPAFDPETELVQEFGENLELGDTLINWVIDRSGVGRHTLSSQLADRAPNQMVFHRTATGAIIDPTGEQKATFISMDTGSVLLREDRVLVLTLHSHLGDGVRHIRVWGVARARSPRSPACRPRRWRPAGRSGRRTCSRTPGRQPASPPVSQRSSARTESRA